MNSPRYLFVSDQGRVFSHAEAPTKRDLAYAGVGMLTIIRLADYHYYDRGKKWLPVPVVGTASVARATAS